MTVYRKTMADAYREMYSLNEDNMDLMRKAAKGAMQTIKFKDGKLKVDSFTASGIMGVYDKVNPKNKASMEKMINSGTKAQIMKLQSLAMKHAGRKEEVEVDEATLKVKRTPQGKAHHDQVYGPSGKIKLKGGKSATGYDLYHKTFSAAMQHSYAFAKKKFGITIDPNEIDQKVASGPKKPSSGKTNKYGLKGDKGGIQVQVYNTGKNYELNMYKEGYVPDGYEDDPSGPFGEGPREGVTWTDVMNEENEKDILIALKREKLGGYFSGGKLYVAQRALETVRDLLRGMKLKSMPKLVGENLEEGTWHEPVGPKGRAGLKKLLKKPVKAKDAIDAIDPYIGDDELFDDIGELEKEDPNKDARPVIKAAMKRLKIKEDMEVYGNAISKLVREHKGTKPHKHPHPEKGPLATVDEAKVTKKEIDRLENDNEHGLVALKLVQAFGTPDEVKKVKEINKRHEKRGHITRQDQQDRTSLSGKYYRKVKEDLDEAVRYSAPTKDGKNTFQVIDRGTKGMRGKQDQYKMVVVDKKGKEVKDWGSHVTVDGAVMFAKNKKIIEEVEIDEAVKVGDNVKVELNRKVGGKSIQKGKVIKIEKDSILVKHDFSNTPSRVSMHNIVKEELDLDEKVGYALVVQQKDGSRKIVEKGSKGAMKSAAKKHGGLKQGKTFLTLTAKEIGDKVLGIGEELTESGMSDLHQHIKDGKSADQIAKIMGLDAKTIKKLMKGFKEETILERVDRFLESARSDAMKGMRGDPDLRKVKDKDDDDDETATDDDIKAASKNIIAQMRKVVSLRGKFKVEFLDGKKEKIDPKIAQAIQKKYNSMRRPADKEKFQAKISKSKKDLLNALKESLQEADPPSKAAAASAEIQKKKKIAGDKAKTDAIAKAKAKKGEAEQQKKKAAATSIKTKMAAKQSAEKDKKTMQQATGADKASASQANVAKQKEADKAKRDAGIAQAKKKTDADAEKRSKERGAQQHKSQMAASYNPILSRIDEKIQERKNG